MTEWIQFALELLFFPMAIGLVIWAVTQRKTDKAAVKKTLAEASKTDAEVAVAKETIDAAVQLADINTLKEHIGSMGAAFREERESLERRLATATETAEKALARQDGLAAEVDDLRGDIARYHREVLDMYRRDQYHSRAIQLLTEWIEDNIPKLRMLRPDLPAPPQIDPLPPLHVNPDEDVPTRRWYDKEPKIDPDDQEI